MDHVLKKIVTGKETWHGGFNRIPGHFNRKFTSDFQVSLLIKTSDIDYSKDKNGNCDTLEVGSIWQRYNSTLTVQVPNSWAKYTPDDKHTIDTCYHYIPVELVNEFVTAHGGLI